MKQTLKLGAFPLLALVSLSACTDDKYDLSDIDTTTAIKVKDLTLPVNIAPITLGDVIKVEEDDQIKIVNVDGKDIYAVSEGGKFTSSDITINEFVAPSPEVKSEPINFRVPYNFLPANMEVKLTLPEIKRLLNYTAENLDDAIEEITELFMENTSFNIVFTTEAITNADQSLCDIKLQLPKGLSVSSITPTGRYDAETGICEINEMTMIENDRRENVGNIEFVVNAIDLTKNNSNLGDTDTKHDLEIHTSLDILNASYKVVAENGGAALPSEVNIDIDYYLDDMVINAVSGRVDYNLDNIHINPVDLSSIPDFFGQEGTDIVLGNPQIYLNFNNPVANYGLNYQVGISLTSNREGEASKTFALNDGTFTVTHNKGVAGPYNYCLSPTDPASYRPGFEGAQHVAFTTLSDVLSGKGLPKTISIDLPDTKIYSQQVNHFNLGAENKLTGLIGNWEFFAPLSLTSENGTPSRIVYEKTQDGWNDDEVDAIEIEKLELNAIATSTLPVSVTLSGYPIDIQGNQINGVYFEPVEIAPGENGKPISLKLTGKVRHLDGVVYTAEVKGSNGKPLSPDQTLTLDNIRVKVSGNYTKEF